ncbi:MAG: gluconate 2-dehydrogenase subunit 3 family protein, partial [Bacteroidota bacterium]
GISGGWAAKELCEKGLKTIVLERGRPFGQMDSTLQVQIMGDLEKTALNHKRQGPKDIPIFTELKNLCLDGYFNSEIGASQTLNYIGVPGAYKGCVPLSEYPKTWAT